MKVCNSVGAWLFLIGVAFGATPIQDLKLINSANGNKVAFTNLGSVSVGSGTTVTTISSNLITVSGNIMPGASNTYDIGSSNVPFRHGYFGTNSLYLGDYKVSKDKAQAWDTGGTNGNNAANLTNFPVNIVQTNQATYTTTVAKASTAWQNPASATNWKWTKTATEVTLTNYTGPNAVVVPDMLDGLPVTGFGTILRADPITSISGGANVTTIGIYAFVECPALTSVSLPNATTIGDGAFAGCTNLTSVSLPNATTIGEIAFVECPALTSVSLPNATTIGDGAFFGCPALTSVYFGRDAPAEASDVYLDSPNVTNYVTNPQATGWGATWNGRPVVRLPVYADNFYGNGANLTNINETDTLATVLGRGNNAAGQSATNFADVQGKGRRVFGSFGMRLSNIDPTAYGAAQSGQLAEMGSMSIGADATGASQNGRVMELASATNNARGALQLFFLGIGQKALTTLGGAASILLGAGTSSNKNAIVAGDGQVSHGDGSITAGGGFYGSLTLTNGTTISDGVMNGTNGIYFTPRGSTTNYWITFP